MKISKSILSPTQIGVGVNLSDAGDYNTSPSIKLTLPPEVKSKFPSLRGTKQSLADRHQTLIDCRATARNDEFSEIV